MSDVAPTLPEPGDVDWGLPIVDSILAVEATANAAAAAVAAVDSTFGKIPDVAEKTVFVTVRGNDANDGLTLKGAKLTLAAAVTALGGTSGVIQLGAGTIAHGTATLQMPGGTILRGAGEATTTLTYSGTGTFIANPTPGTRIYNWQIRDMSITGPTPATAPSSIGIDLDSVSTSYFENVRVNAFGTGWRLGSAVSGGAVYNTFVACNGSFCTTGFDLQALGSNATRFFGCRANGNVLGVKITDSNDTCWYGGQIESNTKGAEISATAAGLSDFTMFHGTRWENNTGDDWEITGANVRYTMISDPKIFGTYAYTDNGTGTQLWGGAATSVYHKMSSIGTAVATGNWRFARTVSGGTEMPAFVVADVNTAAGTPVTIQTETGRATGYAFRATRAGASLMDINALDGSVRISAANGSVDLPGAGWVQLTERAADPAAPAANSARLYLKDNGAGKTQLMVRFNTGAAQVIATEP